MFCLFDQSRISDWKIERGDAASDDDWQGFMTALGVPKDDPGRSDLKEFLQYHFKAVEAALTAARARRACGLVRVAPDGSGDASTISEGIRRLEKWGGRGTILIAPGRYTESVVVKGGMVVLRSVERGAAVIDPPAWLNGLIIAQADGVVIDGLTIGARGADAVDIHGSRGVTIKNSRFVAGKGRAVARDGSPDVSTLDCESAEIEP